MKFDPATASLSPAIVANNFADGVPRALAYRTAANGTTVYVAQGRGGPQVQPLLGAAFSIDSSAKLIPLPGNPFLAGSNADSVAMHPSGNFVYFSQSIVFNDGGALQPMALVQTAFLSRWPALRSTSLPDPRWLLIPRGDSCLQR